MNQCGAFLLNGFTLYPGHAHFAQRMGEELAARGIEMDRIRTSEIFYTIERTGELNEPLLPYDFIVVLDKDPYVLSAIEAQEVRLFNSAESIRKCDDKMLTYFSLLDEGIPMPRTIGVPLNYGDGDLTPFYEKVEEEFGFPLVVKTNFGSMGSGVFLAHDHQELMEIEAKVSRQSHLVQEYIAAKPGLDTRVLLIGGKVFTAYRRHNENDFRSNIALGGHGEPTTLSQEQIELCEKVARLLGLDYCGIDLLEDENGHPLVCEVNSNAFFQEAEKITGKNIAGAYADYIIAQINQ